MSLCHRNIVFIFGNSWLGKEYESLFFIDMELCTMDLNEYIYSERLLPTEPFVNTPIYNPLFPSKDECTLSKVRNVWSIMTEITAGLKFMHDHNLVHRDLKPKNSTPSHIRIELWLQVLYCRTSRWKFPDLGFGPRLFLCPRMVGCLLESRRATIPQKIYRLTPSLLSEKLALVGCT